MSSIEFKRGDSCRLEVVFASGITVKELPPGTTGKFGIKASKHFEDEYIVSALSWERELVDEMPVYVFAPNFLTNQLNNILKINSNVEDDLAYVDLIGEIRWEEPNSENPLKPYVSSTNVFTARVHNNVNQGNEGLPVDASPPVQQQLLSLQQQLENKANLDDDGKLLPSQLPPLAISEFLGTAADEAAMLALTGEVGDWCVRSDTQQSYILIADDATNPSHWQLIITPGAPVQSVAGKTGAVTLTVSDIAGLQGALGVPHSRTAFVDAGGSNAGAEVGNAAKPFATAQAAYNAVKALAGNNARYALRLGVGVWDLALDGGDPYNSSPAENFNPAVCVFGAGAALSTLNVRWVNETLTTDILLGSISLTSDKSVTVNLTQPQGYVSGVIINNGVEFAFTNAVVGNMQVLTSINAPQGDLTLTLDNTIVESAIGAGSLVMFYAVTVRRSVLPGLHVVKSYLSTTITVTDDSVVGIEQLAGCNLTVSNSRLTSFNNVSAPSTLTLSGVRVTQAVRAALTAAGCTAGIDQGLVVDDVSGLTASLAAKAPAVDSFAAALDRMFAQPAEVLMLSDYLTLGLSIQGQVYGASTPYGRVWLDAGPHVVGDCYALAAGNAPIGREGAVIYDRKTIWLSKAALCGMDGVNDELITKSYLFTGGFNVNKQTKFADQSCAVVEVSRVNGQHYARIGVAGYYDTDVRWSLPGAFNASTTSVQTYFVVCDPDTQVWSLFSVYENNATPSRTPIAQLTGAPLLWQPWVAGLGFGAVVTANGTATVTHTLAEFYYSKFFYFNN